MSKDRKRTRPAKLSRRQFLGQASCAAVGTTALMSTVLNMEMFSTLAGTAPDYKALVCLFFSGGIDSFNLLVPRGAAEHAEYAGARGDLALPRESLLPINPATADGREYGLHPALSDLAGLFEQSRLALLANVGTLVEPTTLDQYRNGSVALPLGLFSHSDQVMHWQTSLPDRRNASGWAGRMAEILDAGNCNPNLSMNISLSGTNVFQTSESSSHYTIGPNGSQGLERYGANSPPSQAFTTTVDGLLGQIYHNLFEKTYATRMRRAIDAHLEFSAALDSVPPLSTEFADDDLSRRFRMIALTIAAREALCMRRQTFFVEVGGWDHHDEVLANQEAMLPRINRALVDFEAALDELGLADQVTVFTASDFGRTLSSNGRGSDHAWGGNHMIVGGAVRGGDLYGTFPPLYPGSPLDTDRGRLIPTTSVDQYFAELALWFGVPPADLELVLPNLGRFYAAGSSSPPLGFLAQAARGRAAIRGAGRTMGYRGTPGSSAGHGRR